MGYFGFTYWAKLGVLMGIAIEIDLLLQRTVGQRGRAKIQNDAVGFYDPGYSSGSTVRSPRPIIWIKVDL